VRSTVLLLPTLMLFVGCDSCNQGSGNPSTSATTSSSTVPAPSASTPPAASSVTLAPSGKMAHCPDAVPGAKTAIADVPGGVEITVTGANAAATADIRARVQALIDAQKNQGANIKHTGTGEGGGLLGRCPVVLKQTSVVAADVDSGSKITVKANDPKEVDWLRRETREREEDLEKAGGSPAGAGKMAHCPSAVEGAKTTISNTKDGVSIVVVATADDATKAIRDRSKHLVDISKTEEGGAAMTHTGEGGGGGGVGRCPVVLTDTTIAAKDVPGGSQLDVKAKAATAVTALQKETKERAEKFQLPAAPSGSAAPGPGPAPSK
jgi:TusA-related sulfurtransferase